MVRNTKSNVGNVTLFSKVTHELKNPIHGIQGVSSCLYENWDAFDENTKKSSVDKIHQASTELKNLADKLFQLFSLNSDDIICKLERINVVEVLQRAVDVANLTLTKDNFVNIFLDCKDKEIYVNLDPFWIGQVLSNLITNALNHANAKNIKITLSQQEKECIISVVDDGVGLPQNELELIFDPFIQSSTTSTDKKGSGIGLTLCREVMAHHGGRIYAENNKEGGAAVSFTLLRENE